MHCFALSILRPLFSHGAVVFPTWHRPYVMLIEVYEPNDCDWHVAQLLCSNPSETSPINWPTTSKLKTRMNVECGSRLPRNCVFRTHQVISDTYLDDHISRRYWDWAEKDVSENGLPPVLYEDKVEIMAAGGQKQIIDNPLSFFSFVDGIPSDFGDETLRVCCFYLFITQNLLKCGW